MALGTAPNPLSVNTTKGLEATRRGGLVADDEGKGLILLVFRLGDVLVDVGVGRRIAAQHGTALLAAGLQTLVGYNQRGVFQRVFQHPHLTVFLDDCHIIDKGFGTIVDAGYDLTSQGVVAVQFLTLNDKDAVGSPLHVLVVARYGLFAIIGVGTKLSAIAALDKFLLQRERQALATRQLAAFIRPYALGAVVVVGQNALFLDVYLVELTRHDDFSVQVGQPIAAFPLAELQVEGAYIPLIVVVDYLNDVVFPLRYDDLARLADGTDGGVSLILNEGADMRP